MVELGDIAIVEARDSIAMVADLTVSLNGAVCGTRTAAGKPTVVQGPIGSGGWRYFYGFRRYDRGAPALESGRERRVVRPIPHNPPGRRHVAVRQ